MSVPLKTANLEAIARLRSVLDANLATVLTETPTIHAAADVADITVAGASATVTFDAGALMLSSNVRKNDRALFSTPGGTGDYHLVESVTSELVIVVNNSGQITGNSMASDPSGTGTVTIDRPALSDLDSKGVEKEVDEPEYRMGMGPGPVPVNATSVAHISRRNIVRGTPSMGGSDFYRESGRVLTLGLYLQLSIAPIEPTEFPVDGSNTLTGHQMQWYRGEIMASAIDQTVLEFIADGVSVREPVETVLNEISEEPADGDIPHHIRVELEWEVRQDVDVPTNTTFA